jgi:hypothetical protein
VRVNGCHYKEWAVQIDSRNGFGYKHVGDYYHNNTNDCRWGPDNKPDYSQDYMDRDKTPVE